MSIVDKEVCARQGRTALMQREAFGLHPSWRFRHTLKPTNSQNLALEWAENKIYYVQTRNVYENKQNKDNMTEEMSDIYGNMTRILQKIGAWEGQFSVKSRNRRFYSVS
jgi:hypothetical protein